VIRVVKSKVFEGQVRCEAACDGCGLICGESRRDGGDDEACDSAVKAAVGAGWKEVFETTRKTPRHRFVTAVNLYCMDCQSRREAKP
jgi:hypothetical protein